MREDTADNRYGITVYGSLLMILCKCSAGHKEEGADEILMIDACSDL